MFKNPKKRKSYPAGTFVATPVRVFAIIQLSLAFTILLWNCSLPFMGETFAFKRKAAIYHTVMGRAEGIQGEALREKAERHRERFDKLPAKDRRIVSKSYATLLDESQKPFMDKFLRSIYIAFFGIPTFEMAWMCLSFIIPIMLLLKVPSGREAVWLLPLVAVAYLFDQAAFSKQSNLDDDSRFYPSESYILTEYVKEPLSKDIFIQQKQLTDGWHRYLAKEWAGEDPSSLPEELSRQAERGEFSFYLAQIKERAGRESLSENVNSQRSSLLLIIYILWNSTFAFVVYRSLRPHHKPLLNT